MNRILKIIRNKFSSEKPDINTIAAQTVSRHKKALRMLAEYDRT